MFEAIKTCKKPDLKALRYRPCVHKVLNIQLFESFKIKYPQYTDITYEKFKEIIHNVNGELWMTAVHERDGIELPEGLGYIFIGTCKRARIRKNPDFKTSAELGKVVSHRNWESDNKLAKIFYTNYASKYRFKSREIWSFIGIRQFKREVSKVYPVKWPNYVIIENIRSISRMYKKHLRKESAIRRTQEFDYSTYNEFDLT